MIIKCPLWKKIITFYLCMIERPSGGSFHFNKILLLMSRGENLSFCPSKGESTCISTGFLRCVS